MQLKEGAELQGGKYRIIKILGQGGFGITYLAENTMLEKQIALKEFFPKELCGRDNTSHLTLGTQNNAETVDRLKARFLKEAKNIAKLDHPGIVKIHDVFEENNTAYYVMDYIEGVSLSDMVKRGGQLSEVKAIEYISKTGDALEYIHSRQMTHFDVKPANIMVRRNDDMPVLIDFGLSKQYDAKGDATSTLMQGVSHGFSPIELYNFGSVATFSPQTDVYALGATLYYLLTGTVPPPASDVAENGLSFPPTIAPGIKSAIEGAMTFGRAKRTQSIKQFIDSLSNDGGEDNEDEEEETVLIPPVTPTPPPVTPKPTEEKGVNSGSAPLGRIIIFILFFAVIAAMLVYFISTMTSNDTPEDIYAIDTAVVEEVIAVPDDSLFYEYPDSTAW